MAWHSAALSTLKEFPRRLQSPLKFWPRPRFAAAVKCDAHLALLVTQSPGAFFAREKGAALSSSWCRWDGQFLRSLPLAPYSCRLWGCWSCARRCSVPPTFTECWACGARPRMMRSDAATTRCPCGCTRTGSARTTKRTPPAASRYASPSSTGHLGFCPYSGRPARAGGVRPTWPGVF